MQNITDRWKVIWVISAVFDREKQRSKCVIAADFFFLKKGKLTSREKQGTPIEALREEAKEKMPKGTCTWWKQHWVKPRCKRHLV